MSVDRDRDTRKIQEIKTDSELFLGRREGGFNLNTKPERKIRNNSVYQQQAPGGCGLSACAMMDRKELGLSLCFVWSKKHWWGFDEDSQ